MFEPYDFPPLSTICHGAGAVRLCDASWIRAISIYETGSRSTAIRRSIFLESDHGQPTGHVMPIARAAGKIRQGGWA